MPRTQFGPLSAGLPLCAFLLAVTATPAQQINTSIEPPHSIISLASSPRPQGDLLARHPGDATFERAPAHYHVFAAASVGTDAGVETLTLNFAGEARLTRIESKNKDFVIESGGTCHVGDSYSRGGSCSLQVRFNPQGPGHRLGFIRVSNSVEATPMSFGLVGNGYSPVISFTPSQITTVPVTVSAGTGVIKSSTNLAVDGGDVLYVPDIGNNTIREIDSSGALNGLTPAFSTPASLAADSSGFLYSANVPNSTYYFSFYAPWGTQSAYGYTHTAGTCTPSAPCSIASVGMSKPANMSIDPYDNLFFEEGTKGAAEMPVAGLAAGSSSLNLWYLTNQFVYSSGTAASFAVDANDNIYNFYNWGTSVCYLQEESAYAAEYAPVAKKVAGGVSCGFSGDGGQARSAEISSKVGQIAFDIAGNLYFADMGNQRVRRIDASTGIISTIAGTGTAGYGGDFGAATIATLSNPTGVAVDSQGQVYILSNAPTAGPTQAIRKVGLVGSWSFPSQLKGTTSLPKVFNVANTGNSALTLSAAPLILGANSTDFAIDATTTSCVLTAGAVLAAGRSCNIGFVFKPSGGGTRQAHLTILDNTVTNSNIIYLWGTGTLPTPTMTITSPVGGSSVKTGVTVTFSVSVTTTATTKPTGTVTFKANGATIGSPVTLSSTGTASTTFSEPSANTYTLSAIYSGDANYATVTVSESLVVTTVLTPVQVNLIPNAKPLSGCSAQTFSVKVSSSSGVGPTGSPTGMVQLKSGTSVVTSASLSNSTATLSAGVLPTGSHSFVASYGGDSKHLSATSAPVMVVVSPAGSCSGSQPTPIGGFRRLAVQ